MRVSRLSFLWFFLALPVLYTSLSSAGEVRPPAVAGAFYPGDSLELYRMVSDLFARAELVSPRLRPAALISPHAGYIYSGPVAAAAYKQLGGLDFSTVIIVAPSHREYFDFASVFCGGAYSTPLGVVEVDSLLAARVVEAGGGKVRCGLQGHRQGGLQMGEHALEVQLPFLQVVLGRFKLVPIVMGDQPPELCQALARAINAAVRASGNRERILLVASSDLSHFHSYDEANRIDSRLASYVKKDDYSGLLSALRSGEAEACGGGPVAAVLEAAALLGADRVKVTAQANSGDTSGEKGRVVGYLSALISRSDVKEKEGDHSSNTGGPMGLTEKEKTYLLQLARQTIYSAVKGERLPAPQAITPVLGEKRGAFVTIKKNGELRGCIGLILAVKPLVETVSEMAVAAAQQDPRFDPVDPGELDRLELEISVLTPITEVTDVNKIEVGKDGLIIRRGGKQGLLLPQVASEYGWDRETFLAQTCRKAGLPSDAWKAAGTEISSFRAEVFGEKSTH